MLYPEYHKHNVLMDYDLTVKDVKTGSGDKIGEYAYIRITKAQLQAITEENYKEFVETVVKDSGYNWVAILCDDGTGICFPGSMYYVGTYGKQDTDGSILEDYGAITLDENGDREFAFARKPGADTQLRFDELDLSIIDEARVFHFGTLSLTEEPARSTTYRTVKYAKAHGKLITFDPNLRKPLWRDLGDAKEQMLWGLDHADVVKISDEEVEFLFGLSAQDGAQYILDHFPAKLVFVTCGADGCWFQSRKANGHVDSLKNIKVVDTTGAGDIFGGSAVWKLLQTGKAPEELDEVELREIVSFACKAAGLSTTKHGGISSVPELL